MIDFYLKKSTNETSTRFKCLVNIYKLTSWSIVGCDDAPALVADHLFYLASIWNLVRELLMLSKQCLASCSSQLALPFVLGDLVFLSSKVYIVTWVINVLTHLRLLKKLTWNFTSLLNIVLDASSFVCNWDLISKASIDHNELKMITYLMLHWTLGLIALVPIFNVWHIFLDMTFQSECYLNKHMFMNSNLCFPRQIFCDNLFQTKSMLTFDLNTHQ